MPYATTTPRRNARLTAIPAIIAALLISGCSTVSSDPLTELLERSPSAEDVAPAGVNGTDIVEETIRKVGKDTQSHEYFVGKNESGEPCLLVYASPKDWGTSCGKAGEFSVSIANVVAWLSVSTFHNYTATEDVEGVVYIWTP